MSSDKQIILIILLQPLILLLFTSQIIVADNIINVQHIIPPINIIILTISIVTIITINNIEKKARYQTKAIMLKNNLGQVESLLKILQSQRHEYARHIQMLQALVELEKIDEAKQYINGIAESYWPDYEFYYVDNPALAALLNTKKALAEDLAIDFAFAVKCELKDLDIPPWDLCSIIGNLLDNAIEAAIQDEHPRVAIEFMYADDAYLIYIFNNGSSIPPEAQMFTPSFTTKGSSCRGYGLYLTKKLIDQYNGEIKITPLKKGTKVHLRFPDNNEVNEKVS